MTGSGNGNGTWKWISTVLASVLLTGMIAWFTVGQQVMDEGEIRALIRTESVWVQERGGIVARITILEHNREMLNRDLRDLKMQLAHTARTQEKILQRLGIVSPKLPMVTDEDE